MSDSQFGQQTEQVRMSRQSATDWFVTSPDSEYGARLKRFTKRYSDETPSILHAENGVKQCDELFGKYTLLPYILELIHGDGGDGEQKRQALIRSVEGAKIPISVVKTTHQEFVDGGRALAPIIIPYGQDARPSANHATVVGWYSSVDGRSDLRIMSNLVGLGDVRELAHEVMAWTMVYDSGRNLDPKNWEYAKKELSQYRLRTGLPIWDEMVKDKNFAKALYPNLKI